ncbi:MAG: hypothetical protein OXK82_08440, partial [Deltaproteobacteria bacterium]|nr:hypothetical protein [Deltaproteobacteria bacterium]
MLTIIMAVTSMHPDAATRVRNQAIESVGVLNVEEDKARVPGIDAAEHVHSLEKRGDVPVGIGGLQGAVGASVRQWKLGGAPTDAPLNQAFSVTGRSGVLTTSEPALDVRMAPMPFPVPRCCGDCARTG